MRSVAVYTTPELETLLGCGHGKAGDPILLALKRLVRLGDVRPLPKRGTRRVWTLVKGSKGQGSRGARQNAVARTADARTLASPTPRSIDYDGGPAARVQSMTYRLLRDTAKARAVKTLHNFECQI